MNFLAKIPELESCRFPRRAVDVLFSYDTKCEGTEFRPGSLYLHHAVKEVFLEETCVSVKQSELPLQAAAENHLFGLAVFSWGRAALSPSKMSFGIRELPVFHG